MGSNPTDPHFKTHNTGNAGGSTVGVGALRCVWACTRATNGIQDDKPRARRSLLCTRTKKCPTNHIWQGLFEGSDWRGPRIARCGHRDGSGCNSRAVRAPFRDSRDSRVADTTSPCGSKGVKSLCKTSRTAKPLRSRDRGANPISSKTLEGCTPVLARRGETNRPPSIAELANIFGRFAGMLPRKLDWGPQFLSL